jgi:hypothetical protein
MRDRSLLKVSLSIVMLAGLALAGVQRVQASRSESAQPSAWCGATTQYDWICKEFDVVLTKKPNRNWTQLNKKAPETIRAASMVSTTWDGSARLSFKRGDAFCTIGDRFPTLIEHRYRDYLLRQLHGESVCTSVKGTKYLVCETNEGCPLKLVVTADGSLIIRTGSPLEVDICGGRVAATIRGKTQTLKEGQGLSLVGLRIEKTHAMMTKSERNAFGRQRAVIGFLKLPQKCGIG